MPQLTNGSVAPEFELPDQHANIVRLSQFRGLSPVVLFFYPKDDTTGCTIEACKFRDDFPRFQATDAVILGISDDSTESHQRFIAKYNLPYALLSDKGGRVRRLYGVKKTFGLIPGRVTFVIDREGIVRQVFSSQASPARHVDEALAQLARL